MSCKHPNIILYRKNGMIRKDGTLGTKIKFIGSNSKNFTEYEHYIETQEDLITDPTWKALKESGHEVGLKIVPCRKCIGCRLDQTKEWALRIELESKKYDHNYFLTLTYDPEHLPMKEYTYSKETGQIFTPEFFSYNWKGTLNYPDVQQFIKSLRNHFERDYLHIGLRYFLCGEYGTSKNGSRGNGGERPHYHIILMNCPDLDETLEVCGMNYKTGHPYFTSKRLETIWGKGFINIGEVTWDSISYTAGYCQKKLYGNIGDEIYAIKGQEPEFSKMSTHPGIGREYFNLNMEKIYKHDEIINSKGQSVKPPSYFDRVMIDIGNEETMEDLKKQRSEYTLNELKKKMSQTGKTMKEQLELEERTLNEKFKKYDRGRINESIPR